MKIKSSDIQHKKIFHHETKKHIFLKFSLVAFIFLGYFIFMSRKYGVEEGFLVTLLTWSFFVLCTPIADAGFLIDFPLRLITKIRMFFLEIIVWVIAIGLNLYAFIFNPEIYSKTKLLVLFQHILEQPFPFWSIILISGIGTFVSIQFGDELIDKAKHKDRTFFKKHKFKHHLIIMIFLIIISIIIYDLILKKLGVDLPI